MSIADIMGTVKRESGVCVLCGKETFGLPAKADWVIRAARKIRSLLKMKPRHTVACAACVQECAKKGKLFEKRGWNYRAAAALFFLLVLAGSMFYGQLELRTVLFAFLGALFIAALPYAQYFPDFEPER